MRWVISMDTSLLQLMLREFKRRHNDWSYDDILDCFYRSVICKKVSDREMGYFTISHRELCTLYEEELGLRKKPAGVEI